MTRREPHPTLPGIDTRRRVVSPLARATSRTKTRVEAPAPAPWEAVVLAVDTATRSGWALGKRGRHVNSNELDTLDAAALAGVVNWAIDYATRAKLPIVLVLEAPWGGAAHIVAALGAARERWLRVWRDEGQAPGRVVKVKPNEWRGPVLGRHYVGARRDEIRRQEQLVARTIVGRPVGPDEAPAVLIERWASHAAKVGKAIGKRAVRASVRSWTQEPKRGAQP